MKLKDTMEIEKEEVIKSPKIAIVILNFNGWKDTLECIESLQRNDYPDYLTIVIDNNSSNDSIEKIKSWATGELKIESEYVKYNAQNKPLYFVEYDTECAKNGGIIEKEEELKKFPSFKKVVFIKNKDNLGFSAGNNVGAKYAVKHGYEYIVLLNNDTVIVDRDFLSKIIKVFALDEKIYVVGPKIINLPGNFDGPYIKETFWGEVFTLSLKNQFRKLLHYTQVYINMKAISSPKPVPVYKISGACMAFKSSFLKEIGYLDENVWLSCEEPIIAEQVIKKGGKVYFQPLTTIIHKKMQSPRSDKSRFGILKNHFKQRRYFLKTYRGYGLFKMTLIKLTHNLRLCFERIKN